MARLWRKGLTYLEHDAHDHTGVPGVGGGGIPAGAIVMWSGTVASIPGGWALCDGTAGTPDLRDRFIIGGDAATAQTFGGTASPRSALPDHAAHLFTQPGAHAAHAVTQPNAHLFTQPGGHAAHAVTQPNPHADVPNHTHPVTDPGHVHDEFRNSATTGALNGWGAGDTSTNTPLLTDYDTGSKVTGVTTQNPGGGVATQPHAGAAVDGHSAHAGGAVDAHAGAAVDGHSAHAGGAVDPHSAHPAPTWYALALIMKT